MMLMVDQLRRPGDVAYHEIKRCIVMNEIKPGTTLTELGLARDLGCSQGPVREALLRLQEDGLVIRNGRRGTTVTGLDAEEAAEILALRRRIEMRGALKAVRNPDPSGLASLQALRHDMDTAAEWRDVYGLIEIDMAFHLELFRLAGLNALEQILTRCILHSHRFKLFAPLHIRALPATAARHDVLIDRFVAGDGDGLAEALGAHIDTIVEPASGEFAPC